MSRPVPEFTGHRYKVSPTKPQPGLPVTDVERHTMAVPMGRTPLERAIRAHEVAHALDGKVFEQHGITLNEDTIRAHKVRVDSWKAALELRVNTLCERAGVDMSAMTFQQDYDGTRNAIRSGQARDVARGYCTLSGVGRRASFQRAWDEHSADMDDAVRKLCERAFTRLDGYAAAMDAADAEWGFRVGRYLDSLVEEQAKQQQQPKQQQPQPKQPKQQGKKEQQQQGSGSQGSQEWADVPEWDEPDDDDEPQADADDENGDVDDDDDDASGTSADDDEDTEEEDGDDEQDEPDDEPEEDEDEPDDDEYADGEDEDDPLDGVNDPHCDIDFNDLVDADLKRALQDMASKGIEAWTSAPSYSMPNAVASEADWIPLDVREPDREVQTENGKAARKWTGSRAGRFRRADQLFVADGQPFDRNRPAPGGTVLVDASGSMAITPEDIETILAAAPSCTIALYNADINLTVIVKDGMRVRDIPRGGSYNGLDGPALRWLAEQDGPRVWVSDNYVNGSGYTREEMYRECAEICLASRTLRVSPHDTHGYRYMDDEGYMVVPASFTGYTEVATALAEYHRIYGSR